MADKQPKDPVDKHQNTDKEPRRQTDSQETGTSTGIFVAKITQQVLAAL